MMFFMGLKFVYKLQLLAQYWRYKNDGGSFSRLIQIRTSEESSDSALASALA